MNDFDPVVDYEADTRNQAYARVVSLVVPVLCTHPGAFTFVALGTMRSLGILIGLMYRFEALHTGIVLMQPLVTSARQNPPSLVVWVICMSL